MDDISQYLPPLTKSESVCFDVSHLEKTDRPQPTGVSKVLTRTLLLSGTTPMLPGGPLPLEALAFHHFRQHQQHHHERVLDPRRRQRSLFVCGALPRKKREQVGGSS